jgi:uncharacterized protein (TIGR02453 family)
MTPAGEAPHFFGPGAIRFLRELGRNNRRDWFQGNKTRYEEEIQAPALRFIEAMGPRLGKISPHVVADARPFGGSLSRIYRDTRFSKDKSPYKTHVGIHFYHEESAADRNLPGFFFHMEPGGSRVGSGIWHPGPPDLTKIRDAIVGSPTSWGTVVGDGLKVGGESYARVPRGYDATHRYADDLRRKDFYTMRPLPDAVVVSPTFGRTFETTCREINPLNAFLAKAIGVPW